MLFTTDQQTLDDLNIFGKHSGDSVYAIFNRARTAGGGELLEEMFRFPLSDETAINKRSSIIRFFSGVNDFPFDSQLLTIAAEYHNNLDERTKISAQGDNMTNKLSSLILEDNDYKFVNKGAAALITVLNSLRNFISALDSYESNPYYAECQIILDLLKDEVFTGLPQADVTGKLSYEKLAGYDQVLRFRERDKVKKLLRTIYELDVFIAVGKVAAERGFVFPEALAKGDLQMEAEGLYYPSLQNAITNSFSLTPDNNVTFLTGANMAGKSTFMKSLGIAMYLAHMGFPVAASRMKFSVMDGIYTTINLPDNLGMGTSHFYAEVLRVKKVARELSLGKRLFVIIDELFRGTNVKDAYEATIELTTAFAAKQHSMFVISTHIVEAGEVLKSRCDNIGFWYLPTIMDGNKPVYTRILAEGITADRHGMLIINNEGILDILKNGTPKRS